MNNSSKPASQPIVIVYGASAIGKPKAGKFKGNDVPAARKAAVKLGLTAIDVTDEAGLALAAKLPAGRIGGSGDTLIPFVNKDLHSQIKAFEGRSQKNGQPKLSGEPAASPESKSPRLPRSWDDIKVGDRVLSQDSDPKDGWWQVTVTEANGDLFKLRWPSGGRGRPFQKHRTILGLICPTENKSGSKDEPKPDPKQSPGKSAYPADWSALTVDQTVLAKEDGPIEQWWEAKIVLVGNDEFILQWRDYPALPQIVRPRSALGLMHPAPKVR